MKVLHIVNECLFGGVLRVALAESQYLNMVGCVSFVVQLFNVYVPRDVLRKYEKANLLYLIDNFLPRCLQDYVNPILREVLGKFLSKVRLVNSVDYVILHNLNALPLARHVKRLASAKIVLYVHNPTAPPGLKKLLGVKSGYRKLEDCVADIDAIITSSSKMRKYVREVFNEDAHIVPPGCEPSTNPHQVKLKYVLVPQRLSIGKRIHIIAELLSKCRSEFYTIFAGSSHYTTTRALKLIKKSSLKRYMIVVNPDDEALTWLYSYALCSVSVIREPFGMYIIEAAAQGTPVIAPKDAGASELFTHGVHGFFFKCEDELPEYVDRLVAEPELAKKMGFEAWKICQEKYTWYHHVMKLVDSLKKI